MYFVIEAIVGEEDERSKAIQELSGQEGNFESNEYSIMYREGDFGWVVAKAKVVTNSIAVRDNINKRIAERHCVKTLDNKWMVDVVVEGINQEKEMTIMGLDVNHVFGQDSESFGSEDTETREYWDDLSGRELDPKLVKKARMEEIKEINKHNVYEKVPIEECWTNTGKDPIGTRWVDVNKGDDANPEYRSRLVAQEIKRDNREDLFAATPPLEAKKMLMAMAVTEGIGYHRGDKKGGNKLEFIDVRRAYFHARARRLVYVKLPEEDNEEGKCGRLIKAMYGTRDAAQNWEYEYVEFMEGIGFRRGQSTPCIFWHKDKDIRAVIHGDDFTLLGSEVSLDWFRDKIQEKFEVKFKGRLGPGNGDDKAVRVLNRIVTWTNEGIQYEADQRHAEIIVRQLGLNESSNSVVTPGVKDNGDEDERKLDNKEASQYRAIVARANYLCQDRSDIQFAVKELCRTMSEPKQANWTALKRLGRYLIGKTRMTIRFGYQSGVKELAIWTDTDFAGCKRTRKSTSGGMAMFGNHLIKSWCSTQAIVSLSSGEAEYYGIVKGASIGIGLRSMLGDFGIEVAIRVNTDASAAKGMANRKGLGQVRHIAVNQLWIQDRIAKGDLTISKVNGKENIADILTKHVNAEDIRVHLHRTGQTIVAGRHPIAPEDN